MTDHSCATESALEFVGMCPVNSHSTCLQQQGFRMHAQIGPAAAPTLQHQRASAAMQHPLCDRDYHRDQERAQQCWQLQHHFACATLA